MYRFIQSIVLLLLIQEPANAVQSNETSSHKKEDIGATQRPGGISVSGWTRRPYNKTSCKNVEVSMHTARLAQKDKDDRSTDPETADESTPVIVEHCIGIRVQDEFELPQ